MRNVSAQSAKMGPHRQLMPVLSGRSNSGTFAHPARVHMTENFLILLVKQVFFALNKGGLDPSHIVQIASIGASTSMDFCDETIKEDQGIMQAIPKLYLNQFSVAQTYLF